MKLSIGVCLCLVSTGISTSVPQVCANVTVAAKEESSALYPVTEGKLTELVIYMPGRDFGSAAVFLGPECIVQLLQMGSVSARTCLFEHSIFRRMALIFERNTSALSVFKREGCSLTHLGDVPFPLPACALRVVAGGHPVVVSYDCFLEESMSYRPPVSCPSAKAWILICSALAFALLAVIVACPLRSRLQALHASRERNPAAEQIS